MAHEVQAYLVEHGNWQVDVFVAEDLKEDLPDLDCDLLIAMGGDGTMLRVGRLAAHIERPVLGISLGRLGFLYEVPASDWQSALARVLDGDYWRERRQLLTVVHWREGQKLATYNALNEFVVARGGEVRPIRIETRINGGLLFHYVADGLIVATPTGSTAYALAVGGPILPPESQHMLLMPIAPHLSPDRAIVFSAGAEIEVIIHTEHSAVYSIDGQVSHPVLSNDRFRVVTSPAPAYFIRFQDPTYFYQLLRSRMVINPAATQIRNP